MSPEGWLVKTVLELGRNDPDTVQTGPFGSQLHSDDYVDEGIPLLLIRNIGATGLVLDDLPRITLRDARRLAKYTLRPGDIVFSRVGRVGSCFLATEEQNGWVISGQTLRIRLAYDDLSPQYLLYALREKGVQDFITGASVGSTRSSINTSILKSLPVRVPTYIEQAFIAEILSTVDRAIEQTEAQIAKNRRIKTGLMHDLLTRGIDEHGNLRDPATHKFKPSPVGMVPEGWEVRELQKIASVDRGQFTHRPRNDPAFYGGPYPFVQTGDITRSVGRRLKTYSQTLSKRGTIVSRLFPVDTIAVTIAANIADTAILSIPMFFPDSIVGVRVEKGNSTRFVELCIRDRKRIFDALAPQSAQKNINLEDLRPMLLPIPCTEEQHRISETYELFDQALELEESSMAKLQRLKTGLTQDLLAGKVSVAPLFNAP